LTIKHLFAGIRPAKAKPKRKPLPRWREAELYFKQHRDPQMVVSLPRLKCLEAEGDD